MNRRLPFARDFIVREGLNEFMGPVAGEIGIITQGGLFIGLNDRLADAGLSDTFGDLKIPTLVLNVTHPLLPDQIIDFARGKKALLIVKEETGPMHVWVDIGCHALATFPPFSQGHSIIGFGLSLVAAPALSGTQVKRPFTVMGDGGFWHNGLLTGVAGSVFNQDDSALVVMNNGYSSATGRRICP